MFILEARKIFLTVASSSWIFLW